MQRRSHKHPGVKAIRVDLQVYEWIRTYAEGFDSVNEALRKIMLKDLAAVPPRRRMIVTPNIDVVDWRWIAAAADLAAQHDATAFTLSRHVVGDVIITIGRVTYNFTHYIEMGALAEDAL